MFQLPTHVICRHPSVEVNLIPRLDMRFHPANHHPCCLVRRITRHLSLRVEGTVNADWLVHGAEPPYNIFWVLDTTS